MPKISGVSTLCPEIRTAGRFFQSIVGEYGTLDPIVKDLCRLKSASLHACRR